jgi:hypothetical protein
LIYAASCIHEDSANVVSSDLCLEDHGCMP